MCATERHFSLQLCENQCCRRSSALVYFVRGHPGVPLPLYRRQNTGTLQLFLKEGEMEAEINADPLQNLHADTFLNNSVDTSAYDEFS